MVEPAALPAPDTNPLDALGDANRRAVLELVAAGRDSVRAIADELPISRPAVSRHLRILREAGFVTDRPDGTRRVYRLAEEGPAAVRRYLATVWDDALTRFALLAENTAPKADDR